jgi:hypothetical protein
MMRTVGLVLTLLLLVFGLALTVNSVNVRTQARNLYGEIPLPGGTSFSKRAMNHCSLVASKIFYARPPAKCAPPNNTLGCFQGERFRIQLGLVLGSVGYCEAVAAEIDAGVENRRANRRRTPDPR